ncbi:MAG: VOC family protein [Acidimicrobiales bacterium]
MTVSLDHTIVFATDKRASARFLAGILGIEVSSDVSRFVPVQLDNGVTLDYADARSPEPQHYAFVVSNDVFESALNRVRDAGIRFHARPNGDGDGDLYANGARRGFYFPDPDGHSIELMTVDPT